MSTDELVKIARAGGGFETEADFRSVEDLVRIARAAKKSQAPITFLGLGNLSADDLIKIGRAGGGCIAFKD